MFKLFQQGGPLFMGLLSILLFFVLSYIVAYLARLSNPTVNKIELSKKTIERIKSVSTLALVIGILGQLIGLYGAFSSIELSQGITPKILIAGFKISMITTIYGIIIFIIGQICTLLINSKANNALG